MQLGASPKAQDDLAPRRGDLACGASVGTDELPVRLCGVEAPAERAPPLLIRPPDPA